MAKRRKGLKRNKTKVSYNYLERERTILADERTFLAYIRTALSVLIFAIFLIKFFPDIPNIYWIFALTVAVGIGVLVIGFAQFILFRNKVNNH